MKKTLGQFYTTNYDYILSGMSIPDNITKIIEPFAGNGDLLNFIKGDKKIICYDIDPKHDYIIKRNTIKDPPEYDGFVLTNPPFLARNKNSDKTLYDLYNQNDLYKCFIVNLINSQCEGGIIIVPLNFICSIRRADIDLRKQFLSIYNIIQLNIFEERVFDDTPYSVCALYFLREPSKDIHCTIFPSKTEMTISLNKNNNYMIGGEIYKLPITNKYKVERATRLNKVNTNILLQCMDNNSKNCLGLSIVKDEKLYIDKTPNLTARSYATLVITPAIDANKQKLLVDAFNDYITKNRKKYNSLFLTNYREDARKRISFELAFRICNYLLNKYS